MARIDLIVGPVGAGKSTLLRKMVEEENSVGIEMDAYLQPRLSDLMPRGASSLQFLRAYSKQSDLLFGEIWQDVIIALEAGHNVAYEFGLMLRIGRERIYELVDRAHLQLRICVVDAPYAERLERVRRRNIQKNERPILQVTDETFERASKIWQPLQKDELATRDVMIFKHEPQARERCFLH